MLLFAKEIKMRNLAFLFSIPFFVYFYYIAKKNGSLNDKDDRTKNLIKNYLISGGLYIIYLSLLAYIYKTKYNNKLIKLNGILMTTGIGIMIISYGFIKK